MVDRGAQVQRSAIHVHLVAHQGAGLADRPDVGRRSSAPGSRRGADRGRQHDARSDVSAIGKADPRLVLGMEGWRESRHTPRESPSSRRLDTKRSSRRGRAGDSGHHELRYPACCPDAPVRPTPECGTADRMSTPRPLPCCLAITDLSGATLSDDLRARWESIRVTETNRRCCAS